MGFFDLELEPKLDDVGVRESDESELSARMVLRGASQLNRIRHFLEGKAGSWGYRLISEE